jgi:uncharacterized protein (DUF2384 family)
MITKNIRKQMEEEKSNLKKRGRLFKSQIKGIPDLIWSLALISISSQKGYLQEWFNSPVPALKGRTPIKVIQEDAKGEEIIFAMLKRIDGGFPCGD